MSRYRRKWWYPIAMMSIVITAGIAIVFGEFAYADARFGEHTSTTVTVTVNTTVLGGNN